MVQIDYGAKEGKGWVEVSSQTLVLKLEQPMYPADAREWLFLCGVNLEVRTKDRIDFSKLLPLLMKEVGLNRLIRFLFELRTVGLFVSNEATVSLTDGYSATQLAQAMDELFPV